MLARNVLIKAYNNFWRAFDLKQTSLKGRRDSLFESLSHFVGKGKQGIISCFLTRKNPPPLFNFDLINGVNKRVETETKIARKF